MCKNIIYFIPKNKINDQYKKNIRSLEEGKNLVIALGWENNGIPFTISVILQGEKPYYKVGNDIKKEYNLYPYQQRDHIDTFDFIIKSLQN